MRFKGEIYVFVTIYVCNVCNYIQKCKFLTHKYETVNWYQHGSLLILPIIACIFQELSSQSHPKLCHSQTQPYREQIVSICDSLFDILTEWGSSWRPSWLCSCNLCPLFCPLFLSEQSKCSHHIHASFLHQRVCMLHRHLPSSHHPRCFTPPQHEESGDG